MINDYVCVIGSLNYDFFISIDRAPLTGETMHAKKVEFSYGGKGANQAYQIGKLGIPTYMVGCVGSDSYGLESMKSLIEVGVNTSLIKEANTNTGLGFVSVLADGEVQATIDKGANYFVSKEMIQTNYNIIFNSKIIVLQLEIPVDVVEYIIEEASKHDCVVVLNPAPASKLKESTLKLVDYLVVNEVEAAYYMGGNYSDEELIEKIFDLRNQVKSGLVLTLGSKGSYYVNDDITFIPIVETKAVDTTGAGDSYIGAFVYGIYNGKSPVESCKLGAKASSQTVSDYGRKKVPSQI